MQSILLFVPAEAAEPGRGANRYAVELARRIGAHLTAFVVNLDVTTPGREENADAFAARLNGIAGERGVPIKTLTRHTHAIGIHEVVAEHARLHDLVVIGCDNQGILTERAVAEHLLFDSGRPVLVVPADYHGSTEVNTALVGWDNTRAAARAIGDAKPLLKSAETILLTVDDDKQIRGDVNREELVAALSLRGLRAGTAAVQRGSRGVAQVIQDEAAACGADLLVMGAYGHSRLHRFVLGSATSGLLDAPRLPTLLSH